MNTTAMKAETPAKSKSVLISIVISYIPMAAKVLSAAGHAEQAGEAIEISEFQVWPPKVTIHFATALVRVHKNKISIENMICTLQTRFMSLEAA